ncbi:MAG: hypothetical protein KatS3mg131_0443 [Candidatus Tectimicrobiota bacterium]|nr:MAG: hypothetical protein KatS3mg131_0443 [Candidatus Tectomicrobia bacterium]
MALDIPLAREALALPADPANSAQRAEEVLAAWQQGTLTVQACRQRLNDLARQYPTALSVWAALGELVLPEDVVAAYAFFRTGYHRGLDRARASGWNGSQHIPWTYDSNRGFLRCLYGLMQAATAIGETAEAVRTRQFLLDLDPTDHFGLSRPQPHTT